MEGIDEEAVTAWLAEHVALTPPLKFGLIAGGRSNLTFQVTDSAGREVVVRRPPTGHVLPTAHDMAREHRIISALGPTPVPVPHTLGLCEDESVNQAPFYVMECVHGHVLRDAVTAERELGEPSRARAGKSIIEVLAALQQVDVDTVGLGDLGRRDGYLSRQLERWHGQFDKSQVEGIERPGVVDTVYERLSSCLPVQQGCTLVHGDYRLDNTMLDDQGNVIAVLDWEICTLGDPLADFGLLMVYWSERGDDMVALGAAPTLAPGFGTRAELRRQYAATTKRDLSGLDYYVAFGYWKLACILQGVLARYIGGAGGGDRSGVDMFGENVRLLAQAAERSLDAIA
ncbi:MAG: phosphotransferase family protein [Acidimicrobiales bacterium]